MNLLSDSTSEIRIEVFLLRLGCAAALGAWIAWRPFSRLAGGKTSKPEVAYALLLMTLASALVIVVIGDSLARAFGVVGLGSFVRFRTSIKDPGDVVLFFLSIGVGMACGLGAVHFAAVGLAVITPVLLLRDRSPIPTDRGKTAGAPPPGHL